MGPKQQEPLISEYVNISYEERLKYQQDNISWLMEFQYCTFLHLSKQQGKLNELQRKCSRSNQVSPMPLSTDSIRRRSHGQGQNLTRNRQQHHSVSIDETTTGAAAMLSSNSDKEMSIDETDTTSAAGQSSNVNEEMEEDEESNTDTGHGNGYCVVVNSNVKTKASSAKAKSKHIASAPVLKRLIALLDAHVNFIDASPLGDEQLDNTNDILLVNVRNVAWTGKEGGITHIQTSPEKKWIVAIFGPSELHAKRLFVYLVKAHASNDKLDIYPGNYEFISYAEMALAL